MGSKSTGVKSLTLILSLGREQLDLNSEPFTAELSAKIWDYGVLSITIQIPIPENTGWNELISLGAKIENSDKLDALAVSRKNSLRSKILPAITNPSDWKIYEDYITYFIEKAQGIAEPLELLSKADVASLILAEKNEPLSLQSRKIILENALQYSKNDLAVIDWNSALLVEPEGQKDAADVIEFCLTHLLEMRYYDDLIEEKLYALYDAIEKKHRYLLTNLYLRLSEDASRKYLEFSEFLGRVENSLKTVGDFYLATVFRTAGREFRFDDWRESNARKMESLAKISQLLQGEVNSRRSHILEIIIIILIAVELVPVFLKMLSF